MNHFKLSLGNAGKHGAKNMASMGWMRVVGGTCPPCKTGCKQTCMNYGYGFNIAFLFR